MAVNYLIQFDNNYQFVGFVAEDENFAPEWQNYRYLPADTQDFEVNFNHPEWYYGTADYQGNYKLRLVIDRIREERTTRLMKTDWTQIPDVVMTDEKREEYRAYRQALRDLPDVVIAFNLHINPPWPTPPSNN
jgi:hypothetical protein